MYIMWLAFGSILGVPYFEEKCKKQLFPNHQSFLMFIMCDIQYTVA